MTTTRRISSTQRRRYRRVATAIGIALSTLAGCTAGNDSANASGYRGRVLPQPMEKVDFTLTDTQGQPFHFRQATDGHVTLVFFGYTHCPDICPIHMANIAAVLDDFSFELRQQFKVIFVSADPERDTPERIRAWLDNFDDSFIGLRGPIEEVNAVSVSLGLPGSVKVETEDGGYLVGHPASVLAFTKDNLAHIIYPFGTRQVDWAHDLPKLANEDWGT